MKNMILFMNIFFRGFDIWDLLPAYRDKFHWYSLSLVLNNDKENTYFHYGPIPTQRANNVIYTY